MPTMFPPRPLPILLILGQAEGYPVARIFCVGRNYAAHAAEMGSRVDVEEPFWFTKSCFSIIPSGSTLPYPPGTNDLHHEVELVVALGDGGAPLAYGCGLDMTRRDLQNKAKDGRKPWDIAKDFEGAAVIGALSLRPAEPDARITLSVDGSVRQEARLIDMARGITALLDHLRGFYDLGPGDLVMTGTPAGVGAVWPGARLEGRVDGLPPVGLVIGASVAQS